MKNIAGKLRSNMIWSLALLCVVASAAAFLIGAAPSTMPEPRMRLGGQSRIDTAVSISAEGWQKGADNVVIANGYAFPDAMAGVPLAASMDAPILLTKGEAPEQALLDRLVGMETKHICILGGSASISDGFAARLTDEGYTVERIQGADRYATCAAAAERMAQESAPSSEVFIASGANFPDALSVGPAAGVLRQPVLYAAPDGSLSPETIDYIRRHGITRAVILGGEAAVPSDVYDVLYGAGVLEVQRISGSDRYQTSLEINRRYGDILDGKCLAVASGENFPDALAGGAFAAKKAMPVMLVCSTRSVPGAYEYLTARKPDTAYILGLEGALSAYVTDSFLEGTEITTTTTTTTTTAPPVTNGKKAYLTFDDGPSANTAKILDILDKYGVKATFFVIYRSGYESTYKDIVDRGHTLALHSYTHSYSKIYRSTSAYFDDLERLSDYIHGLTGLRPTIMRFPGGGSNTVSRDYCRGIMSTLTKEVQKRGYRYYDWNVDSGDADDTCVKASTLVANVKRWCGSQKSAMILMHDSPSKTSTVTALPDIIDYLRSKGYQLLPITESTPMVHHPVNN